MTPTIGYGKTNLKIWQNIAKNDVFFLMFFGDKF